MRRRDDGDVAVEKDWPSIDNQYTNNQLTAVEFPSSQGQDQDQGHDQQTALDIWILGANRTCEFKMYSEISGLLVHQRQSSTR